MISDWLIACYAQNTPLINEDTKDNPLGPGARHTDPFYCRQTSKSGFGPALNTPAPGAPHRDLRWLK